MVCALQGGEAGLRDALFNKRMQELEVGQGQAGLERAGCAHAGIGFPRGTMCAHAGAEASLAGAAAEDRRRARQVSSKPAPVPERHCAAAKQ